VRLGRPLQRLMLTADERSTLENRARRRTTAQALALRARIVLQAANGDANTRIARREGVPNATVGKWRGRFLRTRLDRLLDEPRPGVPRKITDAEVEALISRTLESTPRCHALEHANDGESLRLQPIEYFRGSGERLGCSRIASRPSNCKDPLFIEKVRDILGLYLETGLLRVGRRVHAAADQHAGAETRAGSED
jgi:transposase